MISNEILKKIRKIEIKTKGLSNHIFAGEYQTAFKGKGMTFSEVREYNFGDDVRKIDWNVTARYNNPYVKVFEEEREITLMLLVDVSASGNFGTKSQFKRELAAEISAILAFSAIKNNDKVGVIFFSEKVELFIPPKKGKQHILRIIKEILTFKPKKKGTCISEAIKYFNNVIKKRSILFILSDFISDDLFEKPLKLACKKHDVIGINIFDFREYKLPKTGLVNFRDLENQITTTFDLSSLEFRNYFQNIRKNKMQDVKETFKTSGGQIINLQLGKNYVKPLINFFKNR